MNTTYSPLATYLIKVLLCVLGNTPQKYWKDAIRCSISLLFSTLSKPRSFSHSSQGGCQLDSFKFIGIFLVLQSLKLWSHECQVTGIMASVDLLALLIQLSMVSYHWWLAFSLLSTRNPHPFQQRCYSAVLRLYDCRVLFCNTFFSGWAHSHNLCTSLEITVCTNFLRNRPSWLMTHTGAHLIKCSLVAAAQNCGCNTACLVSPFHWPAKASFCFSKPFGLVTKPMATAFLHQEIRLLTGSIHIHKSQRRKAQQERSTWIQNSILSTQILFLWPNYLQVKVKILLEV